jgi:hypothetical protein
MNVVDLKAVELGTQIIDAKQQDVGAGPGGRGEGGGGEETEGTEEADHGRHRLRAGGG